MNCFRKPRLVLGGRGAPTPRGCSGIQVSELGVLDAPGQLLDQRFQVLQLAGDDLGADLALERAVEGIVADGDGLVQDALCVVFVVYHVVVVDDRRPHNWGEVVVVVVVVAAAVVVSDHGSIPGHELAADNGEDQLHLRAQGAGAFEHVGD